jgi:hypothetical protein
MLLGSDFAALAGRWQGRNAVYLPGQPDIVSETSGTVALAAQGQVLTWTYTWAENGRAQDGLLAFGQANGAWYDTWHTGGAFMIFRAEPAEAAMSLLGSYAAPPGPDWGWRINFQVESANAFRLVMYNITPDGQEYLGVEATYERTE